MSKDDRPGRDIASRAAFPRVQNAPIADSDRRRETLIAAGVLIPAHRPAPLSTNIPGSLTSDTSLTEILSGMRYDNR